MPVIDVVAAITRNTEQKILLSKRKSHQHQGNRWEFPGGKVEPGESLHNALARELDEELGIQIHASRPFMCIEHQYPGKKVRIYFREVLDWSGEPESREGQRFDWFTALALTDLEFPEANRPVVKSLQLGDNLLITPSTEQVDGESRFLERLQEGIQTAERPMVYLRQLDCRPALLASAVELCRMNQCQIMLQYNKEQFQAKGLAPHILHFSTSQLNDLKMETVNEIRRAFSGFLSAACHCPEDLTRAEQFGLDMVLVSPVQQTGSHPHAKPLGWEKFSEWVEGRALSVYALGGMVPGDLVTARENGGRGVAGISGFWPGG